MGAAEAIKPTCFVVYAVTAIQYTPTPFKYVSGIASSMDVTCQSCPASVARGYPRKYRTLKLSNFARRLIFESSTSDSGNGT